MKTIKISLIIVMASLAIKTNAQLQVLSNGYVGVATTIPQNTLDVKGDIQFSTATIPIGMITEVGGTNPLLNMSVNFREPNKNTKYIGGTFRIDTRNTSTMPLFQWYSRYAGSNTENFLMELNSSGQLGIGIHPPSCTLDINGVAKASGVILTSDERLKDNVKNMTGSLALMSRLRGVTYKLKSSIADASLNSGSSAKTITKRDSVGSTSKLHGLDSAFYNRSHIGFLAQEIQAVYPELVYADKNGILSVDYISLIPVLVESIKELNNRHVTDSLNFQSKLNELEKKLNQCCSTPKTKSAEVTINTEQDANLSQPILYQNIPNPFTQNTEIRYFLPDDIRSASLYLYNMQGAQIKSIPVNIRGNGSEIINGSELTAGMYLYSLIADGREIDTKRMILTQ